MKNREKGHKTLPQTLSLDQKTRLLVISGPNAGGKSITLKTVGLLQLMLQSGLLVCCRDYSRFSFFEKILTDIGDNQSIEDELSTYSYRLHQMKHILKVSNGKTLVLLDEFGTGSDPELGGALAEVFFEELHRRKCFGVLTTHYMNIKVLADRLDGVVNGCMLFDRENLNPRFELSVGQPGSSFTFEVARKTGLDPKLIEAAKRKVKKDKLQLDHSISDLQKLTADVRSLRKSLAEAEQKARDSEVEFREKAEVFDEKYNSLLELNEQNTRNIQLGKKFLQLLFEFDETARDQKKFLDKLTQVLRVEKAKENEKLEKVLTAPKNRMPVPPRKARQEKPRPEPVKPVVKGCEVKMTDGNVVGKVREISGDTAIVLFGDFLTRVKISKLRRI